VSDDARKIYKTEVRVTLICFILVAITGGFLSTFFVILKDLFFLEVPVPEQLAHALSSFFVVKSTVMGFPLHYFLLIVFSWIGVTIIGAYWCFVMDRLEEKQRS